MWKTSQVQFGDRTYALGLAWYHLHGERPNKEALQQVEDTGVGVGIGLMRTTTHRSEAGDKELSYQIGLSSSSQDAGTYSAAALLADSLENALIVEPLEQGQWWLCAISAQEVLPGGDFVGDRADVTDRLRDLVSEFGDVLSSCHVIAPGDIAEDIGLDPHGTEGVSAFLSEIGASPSRRHRIRALTGVNVRLVALVLVACTAGIASLLYFQWQAKQENQPENFESIQISLPGESHLPVGEVARKHTGGRTEQEIFEDALAEEKRWLTNDFNSRPPREVFSEARGVVRSLPRVVGGWTLDRTVYDVAQPREIIAVWQKASPIAHPSSLRDRLGSAESVAFALDGITAESYHALGEIERRGLTDAYATIQGSDFDRVRLMDALDRRMIPWSMSEAKVSPRPEPITGVTDPSLAATRQLRVPILEFQADLENPVALESFARALDTFETVLLSRIVTTFGDSETWKIYGEIYEN